MSIRNNLFDDLMVTKSFSAIIVCILWIFICTIHITLYITGFCASLYYKIR